MGIRTWWKEYRRRVELTRRSVEISDDQEAIAKLVPELVGKSFVEGGAYIFKQIDTFKATCTEEQLLEFARRLASSNASWEADGLTMPWWGNLVVLRTLQAEIDSKGTKGS